MQNREQSSHQAFQEYIGYQSSFTAKTDPPLSVNDDQFQPSGFADPHMPHDQQFSSYRGPAQAAPEHYRTQGDTLPAVLCYVGLWLTGLLFLLFAKKDRFIRFHAMQSLLFFGAVTVLYIPLISIMAHDTPFLFGFAVFAFVIMNVVAVVAWFVGMFGALHGHLVKLPFVGEFAERYVNHTASVK